MTFEAIPSRQRGGRRIAFGWILSATAALAIGALDNRALAQQTPAATQQPAQGQPPQGPPPPVVLTPEQQATAAAAAAAHAKDPRVGLKAGLRDAGVAAKNLELVVSLPKPAGFFDPKAPAGEATPPERMPGTGPNGTAASDEGPGAAAPGRTDAAAAAAAAAAGGGEHANHNAPAANGGAAAPAAGGNAATNGARPRRNGGAALNFANSDLAFSCTHLVIGNFNGFNFYDTSDVKKLKAISSVVCPGGQGDVSVYGKLLVMSVEQTRGRLDCGTQGVEAPVSTERFRGVRIFDISDLKNPKQLAAVQTCRGSHTHTLVTDPKDTENIYIYGSGTSNVRSGEELAGCSGGDPKDDANTALFSIDVIQVPLASPDKAKIVNRPRIFADPKSGAISGLWQGGTHGANTQRTSVTNQCHDITVFPAVGLAAGACSGNGILLDISDPVHPTRLDAVTDDNFAYWHSATFNNDGTKVIFTDEWGGGTRPRCRATDLPNWGADAIFDIVDKKMVFAGYFKMPAPQSEQENCVAHNGSLIPVPGRDIMVQAWYQGGISIFDFTDAKHPVEIAFFDRGPIDAKQLITGGFWSAYWYNGYIYGSEIARGIDVFKLKPSELLSQNEIDAALLVQRKEFNAQEQPRVEWPAASVVARAYVDQLTRSKAIAPERVTAVHAALGRADKIKSAKDGSASTVAGELETLAAQVETDAGAASGRDAMRLKSLASTLKGRAASLR